MAFESLLHDFRLAFRGLVREPGYSLVAILILAIGIGANTAVFSVVNPLVLKPLPFRDADRLVWIANTGRGDGLSGKTFRVAAYEELARNNRSFESLAAYFAFFGYFSYTLTGSGEPERLVGVQIAPGFLEQLGIRPQLGRAFAGDEWKANGPGAVLLTSGLWKRRFGADPAIVGTSVTINENPKEFAVRIALGSSRLRIVSQLLVEGVVLAACGAIVGVPLAYLLTGALKGSATLSVPLLHQVHVDGSALSVTALTAIVAGVAFGAVPALRVASRPPQVALKAQGRGMTDGRQHARVRSTLVVAEIALATVLVIGAGLLLRSFVHILDVDLGFQPSRAMSVRLETSSQLDPNARRARLFAAARRVAELPGVDASGLTDALPLDRNRTWGVGVPGVKYPDGQYPLAFVYIVGPAYFRAMGISVVKGRDFTEHDTAESAAVGILNEALARQLYPGRDPIGQPAQTGSTKFTIVGVVADVRQSSLDETAATQMYLPYTGARGGASSEMIVRSTLPASSLAASLRAALKEVDPAILMSEVRPLKDLVDRAVSPRRFLLSLLTGFAGVGLLLASLGIYGVISYGVSQRVQEIGVRMALGATAGSVQRLAMAGIALGLVASVALARLIATLLYNTSPVDPVTFVATGALLVAVAALAGYVPALRASRVDPMTALRAD